MKKIHVLGVVLLIALVVIGGAFLITNNKPEKEESVEISKEVDSALKEDEKEEFVDTVDTTNGWENTRLSKMIDEWKSGDEPFVDNLMQEAIQQMAHQKILAPIKEYSVMITPERIATLLLMVKENKDDYEYSDKYLDILNRWKQGDFKSVDKDHNELADIQGTKKDGMATGISTEEQENNYILRVFGIPVEK